MGASFPWRTIILISLLVASHPWSASLSGTEPDDRVSLINRRFASVVLSRVSFHDADLTSVLEYLKRKAEVESNGTLKMPFVLELPPDFKPRYELTLDVRAMPYAQTLRYLAELAGVRLSQENGVVVVRPDTGGTPLSIPPPEKERPASKPLPYKEQILTGPLGKPAEAVGGGNNLYRNTAGTLQPDKSGYVPRRELNGFPETKKGLDVNCPHLGTCPSSTCGCTICTCAAR